MAELPRIEEVREQAAYVNDNIGKFTKDNEEVLLGFAQSQETIRRFDELLTLKLSKISHTEEMQSFEEKLNWRFK